jgi:Na+/H+ antiporter NhaD/arsenite permease-like protein
MKKSIKLDKVPREAITDMRMFVQGATMFVAFIVLMILAQPLNISPAIICLGMASTLLFLGGSKLTPILENVEWSTLLFFGSLFVVVGGLIETGVLQTMADLISGIVGSNMLLAILVVTWVSALGSALIDNIPLVVTMLPILQGIASSTGLPVLPLAWALSLGTCMGGNATIIGTSAAIVASSQAEKEKHGISFMEYLKIGVPAVLLTVGVGTAYLLLRYVLFAV